MPVGCQVGRLSVFTKKRKRLRMSGKTVILTAFTLGLLSIPGQAATYYVDSIAGNDWHIGTAATTPFKTLQAVNSNLYHPGDQILFKAGSVWTGEVLNIASSNESGTPIVVRSYGVGAKPLLKAATTSSAPVSLNNATNVTVSGLTIQSSSGSLIVVNGGSNNTVENCNLIDGQTFPIHVVGSPGFRFLNNTYSMSSGFSLAGDVLRAESQVSGITVSGNIITINASSKSACGIYILDVDNAVISGNTVTGGSQAVGVKGYTRSLSGAEIYSNTVSGTDNTQGGDGESIEFTGVTRMGPRTASGTVHDNVVTGGPHTVNAIAAYAGINITAYNNKVIGPVQDAAFHWTTNSTNGVIYNNTVEGSVPNPFVVLSGSSAQMYNNTVGGSQSAPPPPPSGPIGRGPDPPRAGSR